MLGSSKAGEELGAAGNAFHDEWEEEEALPGLHTADL